MTAWMHNPERRTLIDLLISGLWCFSVRLMHRANYTIAGKSIKKLKSNCIFIATQYAINVQERPGSFV
ncbi:hypothetical protein E2C01_084316 [Portunus trituberculatus]|uniref:Uncharacterized protein n=1 Tax=Portunus trituberculatus TaxID=210409 RepID=A0A5B7JAE1_PORTR|nr:hypothetical protein [Portunus trituberculatus]